MSFNNLFQVFDGTNADVANAGSPVPLAAPSSSDDDIYHLANPNDLMHPSPPSGAAISNLDLAILTDLGLSTRRPLMPVINLFSPDSGVLGDGITRATAITLNGVAQAHTTIDLYDGTGHFGTTTTAADGSWKILVSALSEGVHHFTATASDQQGNTSDPSSSFNVTIDTTAPAVTLKLLSDTGSSSSDNLTSDDTLSGLGDPNATVHFTIDGTQVAGTATADNNGAWSFSPVGLADGFHTVIASESDAAGNTGTASKGFLLDTVAPIPVITGDILFKGAVTLNGTAEPNSLVTVYDGATKL